MNCSTLVSEHPPLQILACITYVMFFFIGTIFNAFALWIFCCRLPKWTETTVFMVNLMMADILILLTFPFKLYALLNPWDLGHTVCIMLTSFYFTNTYMSIFIITAISCDRYLAIRHPLKYKSWMTPMKASVVCAIPWTLLLITSIAKTAQEKNANSTTCFVKVNREPSEWNLAFALAGFLFPLVLISFFSLKILKTLRDQITLESKDRRSFRKAMNIIIANMVIFVVCFSPVHTAYIVRYLADSADASCHTINHIQVFFRVTTLLSNANCVLDSVCYYFAASEFWEALSKQKQTFPKCRSFCIS
ncbi:G-protein coupled receptor 35-like [Hyperolius riggenbachi]|uniref:G-protein coupled receptor 35-like n=1 Tax=Hyperolius riggenbachi TaxID=752182 RepID=UPI0035A2692F